MSEDLTPDLARMREVAGKAATRLTEWLDDFDRDNADDHDNDDFEVGQDELIEVPAEALRAILAAQRPLLDRIAELEGEREIQRIELIRSDNRADALYHRALAAEAQVSALTRENEGLREAASLSEINADRAFIDGMRFGWNCAEAGDRQKYEDARDHRAREIRAALSQPPADEAATEGGQP